jgi:hypothetical protein
MDNLNITELLGYYSDYIKRVLDGARKRPNNNIIMIIFIRYFDHKLKAKNRRKLQYGVENCECVLT